jgi:hypothetical protein
MFRNNSNLLPGKPIENRQSKSEVWQQMQQYSSQIRKRGRSKPVRQLSPTSSTTPSEVLAAAWPPWSPSQQPATRLQLWVTKIQPLASTDQEVSVVIRKNKQADSVQFNALH